MNIVNLIESELKEIITKLYGSCPDELQIQKTRKEFEGDYTLVVFPLLRTTKTGPEQSGETIGNEIVESSEFISKFNVVKGFLNLSLTAQTWLEFVKQTLGNERYGFAEKSGKQFMIEYSSPNTNKPLHLGHIRNNLLGYSVAKILEANGHKVVKVQIINDRGIHICKSMLAWQKFGGGETPESSGEKGDKLVGKYYVRFDREYKKEITELLKGGLAQEEAEKQAPILQEAQEMLRKWEAMDPEVRSLWETMNGWVYDGFNSTYTRLGVSFDKLYYESDTYLLGKENVAEGLKKGIFFQKDDGSIWINLESDGLDEKILLRSDGTAVYMTQDIGTAILRFEDFPKSSSLIYTVGNEQNYHFKVLFLILGKLGYDWANQLHHLSYGMVDLPSGKMKSREGTVVDADDLMGEMHHTAKSKTEELGKLEGMSDEEKSDLFEQIGMAALKYFMLKVDPKKRMLFDPQESIDFNGNTGPFLQYAYARIQSLLRKAGNVDQPDWASVELEDKEKDIIALLHDYPNVVREAGDAMSPAVVANYTYELVKAFNSFYQSVPIVTDDNPNQSNFRLVLSDMTGRVIKSSLGLLGIDVPQRM